ncbi:45216_t:CDS:2, partial [Gigaspora margarita]
MNLPKTLSTVWNKEYGIRPTNNAIINPNTLSAVRNKEYRIRQTIINPKYEDLINDFMDFTYSHEEYPANDKIEDKIIKHSIRTQPSNISLNALINPNIDDLINCYDFEDFIELNEIGQNRHGYVYRAYWDDFKSTVVLKRLEIDINSQEISGFIKETKEKKLVGKLANNSQKLVDGYLEELKSGVDSFRVDQPEQFSTSLFLG